MANNLAASTISQNNNKPSFISNGSSNQEEQPSKPSSFVSRVSYLKISKNAKSEAYAFQDQCDKLQDPILEEKRKTICTLKSKFTTTPKTQLFTKNRYDIKKEKEKFQVKLSQQQQQQNQNHQVHETPPITGSFILTQLPSHRQTTRTSKMSKQFQKIREIDSDRESSDSVEESEESSIAADPDPENDFNKLIDDKDFQKTLRMVELFEQTVHSESDIEEIVSFLKTFDKIKDQIDVLNKIQLRRFLQIIKCQFIEKGQYLFRKNEKGDLAYQILHGKVIFLTLNQVTWQGAEPKDNIKKELDNAQFMRQIETGNDNLNCVEIENVVAEFPKGKLFGEIALLDPAKATRVLSAMTKTDCIFLILNQEAFDLMIKEKLKREREELGKFVYTSMPKLKENFSLFTVSSNVHLLFKETNFIKGQWIQVEEQTSEKIHIIKRGSCGIFKHIDQKDQIGQKVKVLKKIMDLGIGEVFGEDFIIFNLPNTYAVKVESTKLTLLSIDKVEFFKKYKKMLAPLQKYFYRRQKLIQEIIDNYIDNQKIIKNEFYSTVEKGNINVYLMRELKMQLGHANQNMKKKLHKFYLKKEMHIQSQKRPLTSSQREDIQDFKDIMRGAIKVDEIRKIRMDRVTKTIDNLNESFHKIENVETIDTNKDSQQQNKVRTLEYSTSQQTFKLLPSHRNPLMIEENGRTPTSEDVKIMKVRSASSQFVKIRPQSAAFNAFAYNQQMRPQFDTNDLRVQQVQNILTPVNTQKTGEVYITKPMLSRIQSACKIQNGTASTISRIQTTASLQNLFRGSCVTKSRGSFLQSPSVKSSRPDTIEIEMNQKKSTSSNLLFSNQQIQNQITNKYTGGNSNIMIQRQQQRKQALKVEEVI